ncbi:FAS1-like dehydratase domain-containing protein [Prescottella agglutinans]|uniref:Acyl dehydratase n=1 Tax=Prescottella agglutinans TaxID=1644129 RepID=A0ABT6M9J4_9NOCA|nr:MaoC family dehydratase N-terminal domain-containing protein [Prescottella agglutinans]MDH6280977.1 acyl dehydratase [Prescottella agglutinans]
MYGLVVHGSHLMQFARAIGDTDPTFEDVGRLSATGADALVAPPTFLMAADHFDPTYSRRPRPGVSWIGSRPPGDGNAAPVGDGNATPSGFHMEQHFTFHRPVRAGDALTADARPGATWEKSGRRAGTLTFSEILTDYRDSDGHVVATARWVSAFVEHTPTVAQPGAVDGGHAVREVREDVSAAGDLAVGGAWTTVLVEDLTRTAIVMYAGASGDFHPLHSDDVHARELGYPGVFAHGMLTMGMTGRAITDRFGHANVLGFGGRFGSQVWPGDTLTARVEVVGLQENESGRTVAELALRTTNQHGVQVFSGSAEVAVD